MILASLIPAEFFDGQADHRIWLLWVLSGLSIGLLVYGADRAVSGAVKLARALGLPTIVIGATVVSLGTTAPEACVSVNAALRGDPGLALGNGVGSIICDTALIFGLCCVLARLPKDRFILRRQGWLQFGTGVLLAVIAAVLLWIAVTGGVVAWPGWLTQVFRSGPQTNAEAVKMPRWIGAGMLVLLVGYLYVSVRWARGHTGAIPHLDEVEKATVDPAHKWRVAGASLLLVVVGLSMVIGGSEVLLGSVQAICKKYGVPEEVLAVTLVAFGTSLPELVTALAAVIKGHGELLVGNVVGADILNVLFVIGASSAATPLAIKPMFFVLFLPAMLLALATLRVFMALPGDRFRRWQGVPLLALYVVFVILTVKFGLI